MKMVHASYKPVMEWSYDHKRWVLGTALVALIFQVGCLPSLAPSLFPPSRRGDFVIQPVLKTGTSLTRTTELTTMMEKILIKNFPEVDKIVSRIGAAEVPTDPMSMEEIDMIIKLKPKNFGLPLIARRNLPQSLRKPFR